MSITNRQERSVFIKKIILWSVLAGGVIALFVPLIGTGSVNVMAQGSNCRETAEVQCLRECGNNITCIGQCFERICPSTPEDFEIVDACDLGPCFEGVGDANESLEGTFNFIFGLVNVAIYIAAGLAVAMMAYGGVQIGTGFDKQGKQTVWWAGAALTALGLVYIIMSLIVGITNMFRNQIGIDPADRSYVCRQQAESSCSNVCSGSLSSSTICESCSDNAYNACMNRP